MPTKKKLAIASSVVAILLILVGGGVGLYLTVFTDDSGNSNVLEFPVVRPSVEATVPDAFEATAASRRRRQLRRAFGVNSMVQELQDRVFESLGPSNIYNVLDIVDDRVTSLNRRSGSQSCLSTEPVEVNIAGWPGENLTVWIQCYEDLGNDNFLMFGNIDGTHYLHHNGGAVRYTAYIHSNQNNSAADEIDVEYPCCMQVNGGGSRCKCVQDTMTCWRTGSGGTPIIQEGGNCRTTTADWPTGNATNEARSIPTSTMAKVNMYFTVGAGSYAMNESGSVANLHIEASPGRATVEATYGGIGMGFCGVHFVSYNDKIKVIGSQDHATTCLPTAELCTNGNATTTYGNEECESMGFKLLSLGRQASASHPPPQNTSATWPVSNFPSSPNVNFDYGGADNTVLYGPEVIPPELVSLGRSFGPSS